MTLNGDCADTNEARSMNGGERSKMRGWSGVALYEPKIEANLGVTLRNAHAFGAAFVALIGHRYSHRVSTDTTDATQHIPVLYFRDWELFSETMYKFPIVTVEVGRGVPLHKFEHPQHAIYLFGGEDRTVPVQTGLSCHIESAYCLNLGVAVGVVLYARHASMKGAYNQ